MLPETLLETLRWLPEPWVKAEVLTRACQALYDLSLPIPLSTRPPLVSLPLVTGLPAVSGTREARTLLPQDLCTSSTSCLNHSSQDTHRTLAANVTFSVRHSPLSCCRIHPFLTVLPPPPWLLSQTIPLHSSHYHKIYKLLIALSVYINLTPPDRGRCERTG